MTTYLYEVYVCTRKDTNEVVYVGQGKRGRHKHCRSGTSHCYGLNKLHFEGVEISIRILLKQTQEDALELENTLIDKYQPTFNIKGTPLYYELIAKAKEDGKYKGRIKKIDDTDIIEAMSKEGASFRKVAKELGVSLSTVQRAMKLNPET